MGSPWPGVYGTHLASGRHFGRHWHAVFGVGLLEDGAQRSASGRGAVEAFAGDVITTNPGEVHACLADAPRQLPTLTKLAGMVGVSKFQWLRRVEKSYGLPPYA